MPQTRLSLLERVKDFRNPHGWAEFDQLYRPLLVRYARRRGLGVDESEEIAQQCLEVIVNKIGEFKRRKSFRGWLRKIVDNKVSGQMSRRRRERAGGSGDMDRAVSRETPPEELWERQWDCTHLRFCLAALREEFAEHTLRAFEMYVLQERPVAQICGELGLTANQVYVAKSRVTSALKRRYAALMGSLYGRA